MSQVNRLKKQNPEALNNEDIRSLAVEADNLHDIKAIATSKAGETLIILLRSDLASRVSELEAKYKTASHTELVAVCADLSANFQLLRLLHNAATNEEIVTAALEDALT